MSVLILCQSILNNMWILDLLRLGPYLCTVFVMPTLISCACTNLPCLLFAQHFPVLVRLLDYVQAWCMIGTDSLHSSKHHQKSHYVVLQASLHAQAVAQLVSKPCSSPNAPSRFIAQLMAPPTSVSATKTMLATPLTTRKHTNVGKKSANADLHLRNVCCCWSRAMLSACDCIFVSLHP